MNNKKTAVIYIITKLELGGAQKVCLTLFENIQEYGYSPYLISGAEGALVKEVGDKKNVFLLPTFTREIAWYAFWREIQNVRAVVRTIKQIKKEYDTVIVHTHSTKAGIVGRWAALFAGVRYRVHTVHGFGFYNNQSTIGWFFNYICEFFTAPITSKYICVSEKDADFGSSKLPLFGKKKLLIRAAAHIVINKQPNIRAKVKKVTHIFGTVACFKKQKNIFDLLEAFKLCHTHNSKVMLEIIGDGELRPAIEKWIVQNKYEKIITLHGWQDDVYQYMKNWHTFVLTSLWEGLPCAIVEARMAKLPIISYDTGGITEVVKHYQNGLICTQKNIYNFSYYMYMLSKNPMLWQKLSMYEDYLNKFQPPVMVEDHAQVYRTLQHP